MSYQRSDRRTKAPDDWGKPGKSYPYGDLAFLQIVEEKTARQNYTLPAFGSAHPSGGGLILTEIQTSQGGNTDANWILKYETIPGPTINSTRIDFDGKTVNIATTRKLAADIASGETKTSDTYTKTTKQGGESPDFVATEVVESRPIGGNTRPTTAWQFGIAVETTAQLLAIEDLVGDFTGVVGSAFVRKYKQPYNESAIVGMQFVESWPLNGPLVPQTEWRQGIPVKVTRQLLQTGDLATDRGISGSDWVVRFTEQFEYSEDVGIQVIETWPLPSEVATETAYKSGIAVATTRQLIKVSDAVTSRGIIGSDWVWKYQEPFEQSDDVCFQVIETWPLNGPSVPEVDKKEGILVTTTTQLIPVSDVVLDAGTVIGGTHWIVKTRRQFEQSPDVCFQVVESWPIAGPLVVEVERKSGILVSTTTQLLAVGGIVTSAGAIVGSDWVIKTRKSFDSATAVAFQIIETWPLNGPTIAMTEFRRGIAVTITHQLIEVGNSTTSRTISGDAWVVKTVKDFEESDVVCFQVQETWPLAGPSVVQVEVKQGILVSTTTQLVKISDVVVSAGALDGDESHWIIKTRQPFEDSEEVCFQVIESWPIAGPLIEETERRNGILVTTTRQLLKVGAIVTDAGSIVGSNWVINNRKQFSDSTIVAFQTIETWPLSGPSVPATEFRRGIAVTITHQLIKSSDVVTSRTIVGSDWVVQTQKDFEESPDVCFQLTETWPLNGPSVPKTEWRSGVEVTTTMQLMPAGDVVTTHGITGSTWLVKNQESFEDSTDVAFQVIDSWALPGQLVPSSEVRQGVNVAITTQIIDASTGVTQEIESGSDRVKQFTRPFGESADVLQQVTETWPLPGTAIESQPLSEIDGVISSISETLVLVSAVSGLGESVSGFAWQKVTQKPFEDSTICCLLVTETITLSAASLVDTEVRDGTTVSIFRELIAASSGVTSETEVSTRRVKSFVTRLPGTSVAAIQVTEKWDLPGTGLVTKPLSEIDGVLVTITETLMLISGITGLGESVVSSTSWQKVTQRKFEDSKICAWRVVETHSIPGLDLVDTELDEGDPVAIAHTLVEAAVVGAAVESLVSTTYTRITKKHVPGSSVVAIKSTLTRTIPGNSRISTRVEQDGVVTTITTTKKAVGAITSGETFPGSTWTSISIRQIDSHIIAEEVKETRTLDGNVLTGYKTDEQSGIVTEFTKQLAQSGTVTGGITGATLVSLSIRDGGSGFTTGGSLSFSGGGGTGATGTFTVTLPSPAGKLDSIPVTNGGAGYTAPPAVAITDGGGGSGATAYALLYGSPVLSVGVTNPGSGFSGIPTVTISDANGGTGTGAAAVAVMAGGVSSAPVDAGGSGYSTATVAFSAPDVAGGTQAAGTVTITGDAVTAITIGTAGTGYINAPTATISGDGTGATAHTVITQGTVGRIDMTSTGSLYQSPVAAITGGGGSGATAIALLPPSSVASVGLSAPGTTYVTPVVAFSGGNGTAAAATAVIATGKVTGVVITNVGSDYITGPTVATSGGGGTGAVILAAIGSLTYVDVEPVSLQKDLVMRTTVDYTTLPAPKSYPVSVRVKHADRSVAAVVPFTIVNSTPDATYTDTDVALVKSTDNGGNGPALGYCTELYMTDSEFQAYVPGAFSNTGLSRSGTVVYFAVNGPAGRASPRAWTFSNDFVSLGTSAGVYDITDQKLNHGIRFVKIITIPRSY